jgi:hypothetical protein
MREIICPAGKRTRILHILSDSIPQTVRFTAEATDGHSPPRGTIEAERSALLFGRKTHATPLVAENRFRKGMFDTRYAVYVTPEQDTKVTLHSRHFSSRWLYLALGIVLALGIIAGLGGVLVRSVG